MNTVKGQCFDCYDDSTFQYLGQTGSFDPIQVQKDYVKNLKKPVTIVNCFSCERSVEYKEKNGKWKSSIKTDIL